ncbi:MAG: glutaredoxin family protein [Candidatus Omnitrophica bacterium]|jgi:glutaredoxin|nr:glutaredoxin family protein [Candidatus Omnitrophota bacterium]
MDIKIYSTPTCPYCKLAKQYFSSKGLSYEDFDISANHQAMEEMVKLSGQMGVPTIVINGQIIVGFDKARIEELLVK